LSDVVSIVTLFYDFEFYNFIEYKFNEFYLFIIFLLVVSFYHLKYCLYVFYKEKLI